MKEIKQGITDTQLSAPISAYRMMELFEEALASLSDSLQRCPLIADERLSQMGYRKLIIKSYILFFSVDEKNKVVDVERILYTDVNGSDLYSYLLKLKTA